MCIRDSAWAVDALVAFLASWSATWPSRPTVVVPVPSTRHPVLVGTLAQRIGAIGRLPVADVLTEEGAAVAADIGEAARFVPLDVTDEAAWLDLMKITTDVFGCPDVLVNNAGVLVPSPIRDLDVEQLRHVLDVNLLGPILGVKVVGAAMADAGRGSIVNVSSTGGLLGMSMISSYVASKWGLRGFSRSAAIELGPSGDFGRSVPVGANRRRGAGRPRPRRCDRRRRPRRAASRRRSR